MKTRVWRPRDEGVEKPSSRERGRALATIPLAAHPGTRFVYPAGYPILTEALQAACGQPIDAFLRENIFEPLKMTSTDHYLKDGMLDRFGASYTPREVDGKIQLVAVDRAETSEKTTGPKTEFCIGGSSGGVLTCAGDYARFGQMLLNGGELDGARIIGRKTVDLMIGNHTGDMEIPMTGPGFHWGLGVSNYHGRNRLAPLIRSVGTYGWGGAAGTTYFADPAEELMGVCLTQVTNRGGMPNNDYQEAFQRLIYQALV
jgi:CubicO group peptidase (beta-lactamase class C family)